MLFLTLHPNPGSRYESHITKRVTYDMVELMTDGRPWAMAHCDLFWDKGGDHRLYEKLVAGEDVDIVLLTEDEYAELEGR
jgi:hypothetical protein